MLARTTTNLYVLLNHSSDGEVLKQSGSEYYLNICEYLKQLDQQVQITVQICVINEPCDGE